MILQAYNKVITYLINSDYSGYDPYDGASSKLKCINENKYTRIISTYFNKFSPINFRRLLKVYPAKQNQALAFIGRAMLYQYDRHVSEIKQITEHLIVESLINEYGYHCWDPHNFPIQMRNGYHDPGMTDIIGNEAIGRYFLDLYKIQSNKKYKEICISVAQFILDKYFVRHNNISFFKYSPETPEYKWCYNASAIASAYIDDVLTYFNVDYDKEIITSSINDIILQQKSDGSWWYSLNILTGYEKPQIDFHQGFILDALLEYMEYTGYNEPFLSAYKNGLQFYYQEQFLQNGQGIYRYPRKYPVNIHNQAQGIITFTRAAEAGFGDHYLDFACTIAEWTIKNMQDPDGHFYYLKYPFFTNKIPYIRWSDAAMAYALAVYLNHAASSE